MTSREFAEWAAYAGIEPFGPVRADFRAASLMALLAEIYRDRKARSRPFSPVDFMPRFDLEPEAEEIEGLGPDGQAGILEPARPAEYPDRDLLWANFKSWAIRAGGKRKDANSK